MVGWVEEGGDGGPHTKTAAARAKRTVGGARARRRRGGWVRRAVKSRAWEGEGWSPGEVRVRESVTPSASRCAVCTLPGHWQVSAHTQLSDRAPCRWSFNSSKQAQNNPSFKPPRAPPRPPRHPRPRRRRPSRAPSRRSRCSPRPPRPSQRTRPRPRRCRPPCAAPAATRTSPRARAPRARRTRAWAPATRRRKPALAATAWGCQWQHTESRRCTVHCASVGTKAFQTRGKKPPNAQPADMTHKEPTRLK